MKLKLTTTFLLLAALALAAVISIPLTPSIWLVEHYNTSPTRGHTLPDGSLAFTFDQYPHDWNNYFDVQYWAQGGGRHSHRSSQSIDISKASYLTVTFQIVATNGPITWRWDSNPDNTCPGPPAHFRPYFAVSQNNARYNDTGRWWSHFIAYELDQAATNATTTVTLTIPLTPDQWSDVNGEIGTLNSNTLAQFNATKLKIGELGGTFGGGCFFGHGVSTQGGSAQLVLSNYEYY